MAGPFGSGGGVEGRGEDGGGGGGHALAVVADVGDVDDGPGAVDAVAGGFGAGGGDVAAWARA
jgi:hypothetical protein